MMQQLLNDIENRVKFFISRMDQRYDSYDNSWDRVRVEELRWLESRIAQMLAAQQENPHVDEMES